jgi:hypothetical protein
MMNSATQEQFHFTRWPSLAVTVLVWLNTAAMIEQVHGREQLLMNRIPSLSGKPQFQNGHCGLYRSGTGFGELNEFEFDNFRESYGGGFRLVWLTICFSV